MSLQSNIEEEIAIFEKIRRALLENGYNSEDINKIIDYINDTVTNISAILVRESEVSEKLSPEKIRRISNELQSNIDLIFKSHNTELDSKLPSNFKWNFSEDFVSRTLNEIIPSSAEPTINKELFRTRGLFAGYRDINEHLRRLAYRDINKPSEHLRLLAYRDINEPSEHLRLFTGFRDINEPFEHLRLFTGFRDINEPGYRGINELFARRKDLSKHLDIQYSEQRLKLHRSRL